MLRSGYFSQLLDGRTVDVDSHHVKTADLLDVAVLRSSAKQLHGHLGVALQRHGSSRSKSGSSFLSITPHAAQDDPLLCANRFWQAANKRGIGEQASSAVNFLDRPPRVRARLSIDRQKASAFLEDSFQRNAKQRIRADAKLEKAMGDAPSSTHPPDSGIPAPHEDEDEGGPDDVAPGDLPSDEEILLKHLHEDEMNLLRLMKRKYLEDGRREGELAAQATATHARHDVDRHAGDDLLVMSAKKGRHKAKIIRTRRQMVCETRRNPIDCQDIKDQCVWAGSAEEGSCHYRPRETWPSGVALWFSFAEVLALESLVVLTAVSARKGGRNLLQSLGVERPGYSLRAAVWFWPTVAVYTITGVYYYTRTQGWDAFNTVYFLAQVVSAVGAGDMNPVHPLPKVFTVCHVLIGLVLIGGAVGDEVDKILESRVSRMADSVSRAADFQDLLPTLWRVAAEAREEAGSQEAFVRLVKRLEQMPAKPRETTPTREDMRWMREVPGGAVILAELRQGGGALIPWPERDTGLWAGAGWRLKALLPLLKHELQHHDEPMPNYDEETTLDLVEDDVILDAYYEDLLYRSTYDVSMVIFTGTMFFGVVDNWLRGKAAFSMFDGFYFSVVGASSLGLFGDMFAVTPYEKIVCMWLFVYGAYSFNRFMMFASEVFAYKVENSQNLVALLPEGFGQKLYRLRKGARRGGEVVVRDEGRPQQARSRRQRQQDDDLPPAGLFQPSSAAPSARSRPLSPGPGASAAADEPTTGPVEI